MEEVLEKMYRKVMIPQYPEIEDVHVSTMGMGFIYRVTYEVSSKIENRVAYKIMDESTSLFKMISQDPNSDIIVDFVRAKNI